MSIEKEVQLDCMSEKSRLVCPEPGWLGLYPQTLCNKKIACRNIKRLWIDVKTSERKVSTIYFDRWTSKEPSISYLFCYSMYLFQCVTVVFSDQFYLYERTSTVTLRKTSFTKIVVGCQAHQETLSDSKIVFVGEACHNCLLSMWQKYKRRS